MNGMAPIAKAEDEEMRPFKLRLEHVELLQREGSLRGKRVELINGMLFEMSPQQTPHSYTRNELSYRLRLALEASGSILSAQTEVTLPLGPHSAPDPDIVLTSKPRGRPYIPLDSVAIVVEVADTSLRHDLGAKKDLYAAAGIPEYWVVDVTSVEVRQFWDVADGTYGESRIVPLEGELRSITIPDLAIDGAGIL